MEQQNERSVSLNTYSSKGRYRLQKVHASCTNVHRSRGINILKSNLPRCLVVSGSPSVHSLFWQAQTVILAFGHACTNRSCKLYVSEFTVKTSWQISFLQARFLNSEKKAVHIPPNWSHQSVKTDIKAMNSLHSNQIQFQIVKFRGKVLINVIFTIMVDLGEGDGSPATQEEKRHVSKNSAS